MIALAEGWFTSNIINHVFFIGEYLRLILKKFLVLQFDPPGTVNLWQLPNAMQEDQLVGFMSQFGTVYKVKVIRSTRVCILCFVTIAIN